MSKYREFALSDGTNTLSLTSKTIFASNPQGLGFTEDISVLRIGNEQDITYEQTKMATITFDINIKGDSNANTYTYYQTLVAWLTKSPLYLVYTLPSEYIDPVRIRVKATALTKTQIGEDGSMNCGVTFSCMSMWEDVTEHTSSNSGSISIVNSDNDIPAPLYIEWEVTTAVTNPTFTLTDDTSAEVGYIGFIGTYDKIIINANELEESIVLSNGGTEVADPYSKQDFTTYATKSGIYKTFLYTKYGRLSLSTSSGTLTAKWRSRYVSV